MLLFSSCIHTSDKDVKTVLNQSDNKTLKDSIIVKPDTIVLVKKDSLKRKNKPKQDSENMLFSRAEEYPTDDNFNGKPLLIELVLPSKAIKICKDTLQKIAKERYVIYERSFPRSIADDFEHGISTEHISYPRLKFNFQLFESEKSIKPYSEQLITIYKSNDGVIVSE